MALSLYIVPQSLELDSSYETGGECYCAFFNKNGNLLIGCHDGVRLYTDNYHKADKTLRANHVTSIASVNDEPSYLFMAHRDEERKIEKTSSNLSIREEVFKYGFPGRDCAHLTSSSKFIVTHNSDSVVAFSLATKRLTIEELDFHVAALRFDSDENLLVTSFDKLHKYSIGDDGNLSLIWICDNIVGASGIAFSKHGYIVFHSSVQ